MGTNSKCRRAGQKLKSKEARKKIKNLEKTINNLEKSCSICRKPFDQTDKQLLDQWMVKADESGARLFCPECFQPEVIE